MKVSRIKIAREKLLPPEVHMELKIQAAAKLIREVLAPAVDVVTDLDSYGKLVSAAAVLANNASNRSLSVEVRKRIVELALDALFEEKAGFPCPLDDGVLNAHFEICPRVSFFTLLRARVYVAAKNVLKAL